MPQYLYLIFDEENRIHDDDSNYVFTTEGHILQLDKEHLRPKSTKNPTRKFVSHQCPAYKPFARRSGNPKVPGLVLGVRSRPDFHYAQALVGNKPTSADMQHWDIDGWCEKPKIETYVSVLWSVGVHERNLILWQSYEFVLAPNGMVAPEDLSPSLLKVAPVADGFIINNITGIRTKIVQRMDGKGYDVRKGTFVSVSGETPLVIDTHLLKVGHYAVRPGHIVYINDTNIFSPPGSKLTSAQEDVYNRDRDIDLQFFATQAITPQATLDPPEFDVVVNGFSAFFGADLSQPPSDTNSTVALFNDPAGLRVYQDPFNQQACQPYASTYPNGVLIAHRGACTFLEKLRNAHDAEAVGLVIVSNEDLPINPTANAEDLEEVGYLNNTALVLLTRSTGKALLDLIDAVEERGTSQVKVTLHKPQTPTPTTDAVQEPAKESVPEEKLPHDYDDRILYINNHALLNTRLMV